MVGTIHVSAPLRKSQGDQLRRVLLSQGEVRPGIVQGQCWRETDYGPIYTPTPDGGRAPVYILGGRTRLVATNPTPPSHADPRLANRMER
jgi:hypothetical protein